MTVQRIIRLYLLIAFAVITPICGVVLLLRAFGISIQGSVYGFIAIALGGVSTALSGIILAKKSARIKSCKELAKDFFDIRQPLVYYGVACIFLLTAFGTSILYGRLREGQGWPAIPRLFAVAILFGGIEEIGWRYLFQPALEKKLSFAASSVITFSSWAIWHMMYNVIDGTVFTMRPYGAVSFLIGLLGTSFALGCIYHITNSLWLCVFYHALSNAFIQTFTEAAGFGNIVIVILLSIFLVKRKAQIHKMAGQYTL